MTQTSFYTRERVNSSEADRLWVGLMLSRTPEVWAALVRGDPVNEAVLDQAWLRRFRTLGLA